jgi:hypothetical protein
MGQAMSRKSAGAGDEQARYHTASVHQVLPTAMHGGLVCLCGAELPKHRDATEHIIDAYNDARGMEHEHEWYTFKDLRGTHTKCLDCGERRP